MSLVSVVIPNYNHGKFLNERIRSVLKQSFQQIEIIILDDCSSDNSRLLIKEFEKDSKIAQIEHNETNSGSPFKQWVRGLELAKGEFIWIAESDDVADTQFLERIIPHFEDPEVVLVFTDCKIINEKSEVINENNPWAHDPPLDIGFQGKTWNGRDFLEEYQRYRNFVSNASSAVFRKSALTKELLEEIQKYRYSGDWLFWNKISLQGKVAFVPDYLCGWRTHDASTRSVSTLEKDVNRLEEATRVIKSTNPILTTKPEIRHYTWLLNWWLSRYSFKNLLRVKYLRPRLPNQILLFQFYMFLITRTLKEFFNSILNKIKK